MPFKSKQQARWAHTEAGTKALGGAEKVKEWDNSTNFKRLKETLNSNKKKTK